MIKYENLFRRVLREDVPVNMSPEREPDQFEQDSDAWTQNNPDIVDNEELGSQFEVDGLDEAEIEKYSEIIARWSEGIETAIQQLAQIIKFAVGERLADAPGSEQLASLNKSAPGLKSDLSAFKSQVDDLAETVKLAISDASKERKEKINSLN